MRRVLAIVFFLLLAAENVFAQPVPPGTGGPGAVIVSDVGYPRQCCDSATNPTVCQWETCAEMRSGAALATPGYFRLVDIDSALGLDLTRLQYTTGGITNLQLRVVPTVSAAFFWNPITTQFNPWQGTNYNGDNVSGLIEVPGVSSFLNAWHVTGGNADRVKMENAGDNLPATSQGLYTLNLTFGYDTAGGNWDRIHSGFFPANFNVSSNGLKVMAGNYFWSITNDMFIYDQGDAADDDSVAETQPGPYRLSLGYSLNIDENPDVWARDTVEVADGADIAATVLAKHSFALEYVWDGSDWKPKGADANGDLTVNQTTTTPGYSRQQDGDSTVLRDVLDAVSDGLSLSLNWGASASVVFGYNGTNLDMARLGAVGEWQMTDVATRPGEDAGNDRRNSFKDDTNVLNSPITAGTAVDDAGTDVVCGSTYVLNLPNWSVFVKNAGGGAGDALSDVDVQISYDGTEWSSETSTACDTLASGTSARCFKGATESVPYVRVVAATGVGDDTTVDCWLGGNKN